MTTISKPKKQKRQNSIEGQFIPRLVEMLLAPAHRVLSKSARMVIDRIEIELCSHGGKPEENGKLPVTHLQFEEYGIHKHVIAAAIREAEALGFITVTIGRAGNGEFRKPSLYRLTYLPAKGGVGTGCSHEWKQFTTMEEAKLAAKIARSASPKKQNTTPRKCPSPPPENGGEKAHYHPQKTGVKAPNHHPQKTGVLSRLSSHLLTAPALDPDLPAQDTARGPDDPPVIDALSATAGSSSKLIH